MKVILFLFKVRDKSLHNSRWYNYLICDLFLLFHLQSYWRLNYSAKTLFLHIHTHTCPSKTVDTLSWAESITQKANLKINLMMWHRMAKYLIQNIVGVAWFFFWFFFGGGRGKPVPAAAWYLPSPSAFALCSQCSSCKALPSPRSRRHVSRSLHVPRNLAIALGLTQTHPPVTLNRCSLPPIRLLVLRGQKAAAENLLGIKVSVRLRRQLDNWNKEGNVGETIKCGEQIEDSLKWGFIRSNSSLRS